MILVRFTIGATCSIPEGFDYKPLEIFSRQLSPSQNKHSNFDLEHLAMYESVKLFKQMLEARK